MFAYDKSQFFLLSLKMLALWQSQYNDAKLFEISFAKNSIELLILWISFFFWRAALKKNVTSLKYFLI